MDTSANDADPTEESFPRRVLSIGHGVEVPLAELEWKFSTSTGPGGQHVNTSRTRAEVAFSVEASPSLSPPVKALLAQRAGATVRAAASEERSQARNRQIALQRLRGKLSAALFVGQPRRPTRPSAASKRRRLEEKRRQAAKKRARRPPPEQGADT